MKRVVDIGEDALVRRLILAAPLGAEVLAGPGDDCAVVQAVGAGEVQLLKTDAVVEGVHFEAASPARLVGRKALARVLSDIAAMAGTPRHALVTLVLPPETPVAWVDGVYAGLYALARAHGVSVVGGETTRGLQRVISVTLTGTVGEASWISRGGAQVGDEVWVTGRLGGSIKGRHFRFEPRLAEGRWLAVHFPIHAMMDLSDGLGKDLPRMAQAAGLGVEVAMAALPRQRGCTVEQAWGDGEDYELLFALPAAEGERLARAWGQRFPKLPLTRIARLTAGGSGGGLPEGGWDPFV
jgi:thiamine-monophosphate kinase